MAMYYQLLQFKTVVDVGSINKASQILYVSQPALSKTVKLLERQFQLPLLIRSAGGVQPTNAGKRVYELATVLHKEVLKGVSEVNQMRTEVVEAAVKQEIRLGCSTIWVDILLPEIIKNSDSSRYAMIHMVQGTSESLLKELSTGREYDLVLCRMVDNYQYDNIKMEPLFKSQGAIFAYKTHKAFQAEEPVSEVSHSQWIKLKSLPVIQESDLTNEGREKFPPGFFPPPVAFEVEDLMPAVQLLQSGYITLLPLDFQRILRRYDIFPLPGATRLTIPYWLGIAQKLNKQETPLSLQLLIDDIRLFFAR